MTSFSTQKKNLLVRVFSSLQTCRGFYGTKIKKLGYFLQILGKLVRVNSVQPELGETHSFCFEFHVHDVERTATRETLRRTLFNKIVTISSFLTCLLLICLPFNGQ
jgi:hypothetical protein